MSSGRVPPAPRVVFLDRRESTKFHDTAASASVDGGFSAQQPQPDAIDALSLFPSEKRPVANTLKPSGVPRVNAPVPVPQPIENQPLAVADSKPVRLQERVADRLTDLERADALVGQLEQRIAKTAARLEQLTKATSQLGDDLTRMQSAAHSVTASARRHGEKLARTDERPSFGQSLSGFASHAIRATIVAGLTVLAIATWMWSRAQLEATPAPILLAVPPPQRMALPDRSVSGPAKDSVQSPAGRANLPAAR